MIFSRPSFEWSVPIITLWVVFVSWWSRLSLFQGHGKEGATSLITYFFFKKWKWKKNCWNFFIDDIFDQRASKKKIVSIFDRSCCFVHDWLWYSFVLLLITTKKCVANSHSETCLSNTQKTIFLDILFYFILQVSNKKSDP